MSIDPKEVLLSLRKKVAPIIGLLMHDSKAVVFDLTEQNRELAKIDLSDTAAFTDYIFGEMEKAGTDVGYGKYGENRCIYKRSSHFENIQASRSMHLGLDIWALAGTSVFSPLPARVHSFQDNNNYGDYGPTIILEHEVEQMKFYTLYGHLSRTSLIDKQEGQYIQPGEQIGTLGKPIENVEWPPHLHFQVILEMQGMVGDFPGVCTTTDLEKYQANSPDPNLLLGIQLLD